MADDTLRNVVSACINTLLSSKHISTPIHAKHLLLLLISSRKADSSIAFDAAPFLRLTDLSRLESILEDLSENWEYGTISLSRDGGELIISDISIGVNENNGNSRKRKRMIDEDADSAAGDDEQSSRDASSSPIPSLSPLGNLNEELREVYVILQNGTAKGRLLAEQVELNFSRSSI